MSFFFLFEFRSYLCKIKGRVKQKFGNFEFRAISSEKSYSLNHSTVKILFLLQDKSPTLVSIKNITRKKRNTDSCMNQEIEV